VFLHERTAPCIVAQCLRIALFKYLVSYNFFIEI
jgi:hypothetical protein